MTAQELYKNTLACFGITEDISVLTVYSVKDNKTVYLEEILDAFCGELLKLKGIEPINNYEKHNNDV